MQYGRLQIPQTTQVLNQAASPTYQARTREYVPWAFKPVEIQASQPPLVNERALFSLSCPIIVEFFTFSGKQFYFIQTPPIYVDLLINGQTARSVEVEMISQRTETPATISGAGIFQSKVGIVNMEFQKPLILPNPCTLALSVRGFFPERAEVVETIFNVTMRYNSLFITGPGHEFTAGQGSLYYAEGKIEDILAL